ncbi:hypothetical protein D7V93_12695 [Corallococcus llansteffanensis]|uniref:Uncharacterized protein n=2 Tax=Corallococcus llansteffanensis TaxID=2316731 RepID=A0A3A8Q1K0_9BACT|nr:hypothetical protein D7V93_12695 [Corallococcus llansteffanensis]
MYVQGLINAQGMPPGAGANFVLCGTTLTANLATSATSLGQAPTTSQALAQVYTLGDQMLKQVGTYSPSGDSFFSDYATYIDNLKPQGGNPSPSQMAVIKQDQDAVTKATSQQTATMASVYQAYQQQSQMFPGKWTGFEDYVNTTSAGSTLQASQGAVDAANAQLYADMTAAYGQDYAAIARAKSVVDQVRRDLTARTPNTTAEMAITTDAGAMVVPSYVPGSLAQFSTWADTMSVAPARGQPPAVSFTLKAGAQEYDENQSQYFKRTSWDAFFASGSSTQGGQALNIDTSASEFRIEITFQGLTTVQLQPGAWYDSSLMYAYRNPQSLSIPNSLVVVMLPKVTLYLSASDYQMAYQASQQSSGFGVGPFYSTTSSSSSSSLSTNWDDSAKSVTIQQNNVQPIILGMMVTTPSSANVPVPTKARPQSGLLQNAHLPLPRAA